MMLSQIEANLRKRQEEQKKKAAGRKPSTPRADGAKTIGVVVPASVYARLRKLADQRGVSMKDAALAAITMGLDEAKL